jgi:uncharacterized protein YxjI
LLVKSKFGAGRDFAVLDPTTEQQQFFVDGRIGLRPIAEIRDSADHSVYQVRGRLFGIPKHMTISDSSGAEVASLRAKMFSPIKSRMTLSMANGSTWELEGNLIEKDYSISAAGRAVVQITQKVGDDSRHLHTRRRRRRRSGPRAGRAVGRRPLGRTRLAAQRLR